MRKAIFVVLLLGLGSRPLLAQDWYEGLWQGYDGEWRHVSRQLIALAEATPEDKFAWRPRRAYAPPAKCICTSSSRILACYRSLAPRRPPT